MKYDLVILGATSAALGIASEAGDRYHILILNSTSMVAYEFINAYKPGTGWEKEPESIPARTIREELLSENILCTGNGRSTHIYSAGSVFCKAFRALKADILLETGLVSVKEKDGGYELSVYCIGGFQTIYADCIIDTTEREIGIRNRSLNCLLVNRDQSELFPSIFPEGAEFYPDGDETVNSAVMRYPVTNDTTLYQARHQLIGYWARRPEDMKNWKIAAVGLCFDVTPSIGYRKISKTHFLLPSAWQVNPLIAMDVGFALGRSAGI
mgnify:FL=1